MKRGVTYVTYLLVCTCLAACSREEGDIPSAGADEIVFSAKVAQAAAAPTRAESTMAEEYTPLDDTFGTIYIYHTQDERYNNGNYSDMDEKASYISSGGTLQPQTPVSGCWYWGGPEKPHLFHAWNLPHDGEKQTDTGEHQSLVTLNNDNRLGTVDLSMNKKSYEYTVTGDNMAPSTYYRLSNLEYFIGAVCGPLDLQTNGSNIAVLQFKHLVAKIIIERIQYISPDGGVEEVSEIEFSMPNMPNHAYWTTGVPAPASGPPYVFVAAAKEPRLLPLKSDDTGFEYTLDQETDYGVKGTLHNKSCFYIYPCLFADVNPLGSKLGEIEFRCRGSWYYGTLESITTLEGLNAGECISLTLRLKDGNVSGLYPHINEWGSSDKVATDHDKPGIYSVDDWKRFVDYLRELMKWTESGSNPSTKPEPPAGLFDKGGNVNLYCDLDLTSATNYTDTTLLDYLLKNNKKVIGNGHRLKSATQWDKDKYEDVLDDLWVTTNGKDIEFVL